MELEFSIAQKNYSLSIQKKNEHYQAKISEQNFELKAVAVSPNCIMLIDENGTQRICFAATNEKIFIHLNGRQYIVDHPQQKEKASFRSDEHSSESDHCIYAPLPGKILKIFILKLYIISMGHQ